MAHIGLEFALAAFVLGAVGWWVDGKFGTKPWGMVIGGAVGLIGGFYLFFKEAFAANREANADASELRREHRQQAQVDEVAKSSSLKSSSKEPSDPFKNSSSS